MIKLHGFAVSNYYNMVKLALLEKGLDFEIVATTPSQEPEHLIGHPMGKVPFIETEQGYLCETIVILDYIEQAYPKARPLMPQSPFEQARVKELIQIIQLYLELPARRCFIEAFFGGQVPEVFKKATRRELEQGIKALKRRAVCAPYLAGDTFTLADIMFVFSIDLACQVAKNLFDIELLQEFEAAEKLIEILEQRPHVIDIRAEHNAEMVTFLQARSASKKN